jgi:hypothetical protein
MSLLLSLRLSKKNNNLRHDKDHPLIGAERYEIKYKKYLCEVNISCQKNRLWRREISQMPRGHDGASAWAGHL